MADGEGVGVKLEEIRALIDRATPGPWKWREFGEFMLVADHGRRNVVLASARTRAHRDGVMVKAAPGHPDMDLIAAARTLLPLLLEVAAAAQDDFEMSECGAMHERLRSALKALEAADGQT